MKYKNNLKKLLSVSLSFALILGTSSSIHADETIDSALPENIPSEQALVNESDSQTPKDEIIQNVIVPEDVTVETISDEEFTNDGIIDSSHTVVDAGVDSSNTDETTEIEDSVEDIDAVISENENIPTEKYSGNLDSGTNVSGEEGIEISDASLDTTVPEDVSVETVENDESFSGETVVGITTDFDESDLVFEEQSFTSSVSDTTITISGDMPIGTYISIEEVSECEYASAITDNTFVPLKAFDIKVFCADGIEYQPVDYGKTLSVSFSDVPSEKDILVYRIDEETNDVTRLEAVVSGEDIIVETEHFTIYELGYSDTDVTATYTVNEDITATLLADGTLYIEGTGEIPDLVSAGENRPWISDIDQITKIVVGEGITTISYALFKNCSGVGTIQLPSTLTKIGNSSFYGCSGITELTLPDNVTRIENEAFYNCTNLASLHLPNSLQYIGYYSFARTYALESVFIPKSFVAVAEDGEIEGDATSLTPWQSSGIKTVEFEAGTEKIVKGMFYKASYLETVIMPEGVKSIEDNAFYNAPVVNISFPNTLETIGECAFYNSKITSLSFPEGLVVIGEQAFNECTALANITFPSTLETIGDYGFYGCKKITTLTLPGSLNTVGAHAFDRCTSLQTVTFEDGLEVLGECAFILCSNLKTVQLPNTLRKIESCAFDDCSSLENINFPNSLEEIGSSAFYGCHKLVTLSLPNSLVTIERNAFSTCSRLTTVYLPYSSLTIKDNAFSNCSSLFYVVGGDNIASLGNGVFYYYRSRPLSLSTGSDLLLNYNFVNDKRELTIMKELVISSLVMNDIAYGRTERIVSDVQATPRNEAMGEPSEITIQYAELTKEQFDSLKENALSDSSTIPESVISDDDYTWSEDAPTASELGSYYVLVKASADDFASAYRIGFSTVYSYDYCVRLPAVIILNSVQDGKIQAAIVADVRMPYGKDGEANVLHLSLGYGDVLTMSSQSKIDENGNPYTFPVFVENNPLGEVICVTENSQSSYSLQENAVSLPIGGYESHYVKIGTVYINKSDISEKDNYSGVININYQFH